jgi:DNA-binding YbaB/EbfC family protein
MNMMQMMKQAQGIQKRLKDAQEELSNIEVTGESGGVTVTVDGQGKFKSIKITAAEDAETLEDLISTAMKHAAEKASKIMEEKMKTATGGISIPGLF